MCFRPDMQFVWVLKPRASTERRDCTFCSGSLLLRLLAGCFVLLWGGGRGAGAGSRRLALWLRCCRGAGGCVEGRLSGWTRPLCRRRRGGTLPACRHWCGTFWRRRGSAVFLGGGFGRPLSSGRWSNSLWFLSGWRLKGWELFRGGLNISTVNKRYIARLTNSQHVAQVSGRWEPFSLLIYLSMFYWVCQSSCGCIMNILTLFILD